MQLGTGGGWVSGCLQPRVHSNGCACISPRVLGGQEAARWGYWCDSVHSPQSSDLLLIRPPSGICRRGHIAQQFPQDTLASGAFSELHRSCPLSSGCGLHRIVNPLPLLMIFLSLDADLFQCCFHICPDLQGQAEQLPSNRCFSAFPCLLCSQGPRFSC